MGQLHHIFGGSPESIAWWQMSARAILITVFAIALLRLGSRRIIGRDTILDIIIAVILGSALSRTLTGNAPLVPVCVAAITMVLLHGLLTAAAARVGWFSKLLKGRRAIRIVAAGDADWKAALRSNIGEQDLMEELRLHGVADLNAVKAAYLERNGNISVILR